MPSYGTYSKKQLLTCHIDLQTVFNVVIKTFDCSITRGHRNERNQNIAYDNGFSKLPWPQGGHNKLPSTALDAHPYPWNYEKPDLKRIQFFAGFVQGVASQLGIPIRWGGDWDGDFDFNDQVFDDLYHHELILNLKG